MKSVLAARIGLLNSGRVRAPRPSLIHAIALCLLAAVAGCTNEIVWKDVQPLPGSAAPPPTLPPGVAGGGPVSENPLLVPAADHEYVWDTVADVVDDYFRIKEEQPVRLVGQVMTEGRLETFPEVGSTVFEPWRRDSVGRRARIESTLQSIRRRATVRVVPDKQGYLIDVAVYKELENVEHPDHATAGQATFRNDASLTRVVDSLGEQDTNQGWIPRGRDPALEQRILSEILARTGSAPGYR